MFGKNWNLVNTFKLRNNGKVEALYILSLGIYSMFDYFLSTIEFSVHPTDLMKV
jgi:hypothetical protein